MKYFVLALLVITLAASCHKSNSAAPASPYAKPLNGLTGWTYGTTTWTFTGTNPVQALPTAGTSKTSVQMFFTGRLATSLQVYEAGVIEAAINIHYNADSLPDTMTYAYPKVLQMGRTAFIFGYNTSKQIIQITQMYSSGDTEGYYYYTYDGQNISQLAFKASYTGYKTYPINYTPGTLKNNLAGSFPLCFLMAAIKTFNSGFNDFGLDLPLYVNANVIARYEYLTDWYGRIVAQIDPGGPDTAHYYY